MPARPLIHGETRFIRNPSGICDQPKPGCGYFAEPSGRISPLRIAARCRGRPEARCSCPKEMGPALLPTPLLPTCGLPRREELDARRLLHCEGRPRIATMSPGARAGTGFIELAVQIRRHASPAWRNRNRISVGGCPLPRQRHRSLALAFASSRKIRLFRRPAHPDPSVTFRVHREIFAGRAFSGPGGCGCRIEDGSKIPLSNPAVRPSFPEDQSPFPMS